jgi:predicted HicB family RNase H-like nuclease
MRVAIDAIFDAFDGPLALIDDNDQRKRIERVLAASRPAVENAIYRVLSESLRGVNDALDGARVELRIVENGIDLEVVEEAEPPLPESDFAMSAADVEKLTLRIIEPLKKAAAEAAAEDGRSLNNWISAALARHLERRSRTGRRTARRAARQARRAADQVDDALNRYESAMPPETP